MLPRATILTFDARFWDPVPSVGPLGAAWNLKTGQKAKCPVVRTAQKIGVFGTFWSRIS